MRTSFKTCKVLRRMGRHPLVSTLVPAQLPYPPPPRFPQKLTSHLPHPSFILPKIITP